jgi:hypothetical protein
MVQNENGLKRAAFPDLSKHTGKMGSYQNNGDASLKSLCMPELFLYACPETQIPGKVAKESLNRCRVNFR